MKYLWAKIIGMVIALTIIISCAETVQIKDKEMRTVDINIISIKLGRMNARSVEYVMSTNDTVVTAHGQNDCMDDKIFLPGSHYKIQVPYDETGYELTKDLCLLKSKINSPM